MRYVHLFFILKATLKCYMATRTLFFQWAWCRGNVALLINYLPSKTPLVFFCLVSVFLLLDPFEKRKWFFTIQRVSLKSVISLSSPCRFLHGNTTTNRYIISWVTSVSRSFVVSIEIRLPYPWQSWSATGNPRSQSPRWWSPQCCPPCAWSWSSGTGTACASAT